MRTFRVKAHSGQNNVAVAALDLVVINEEWVAMNPMHLASVVGIERDEIDTALIEGGGVITFFTPIAFEAETSAKVQVQIDVEIN